jgi:hypothetical protein
LRLGMTDERVLIIQKTFKHNARHPERSRGIPP